MAYKYPTLIIASSLEFPLKLLDWFIYTRMSDTLSLQRTAQQNTDPTAERANDVYSPNILEGQVNEVPLTSDTDGIRDLLTRLSRVDQSQWTSTVRTIFSDRIQG